RPPASHRSLWGQPPRLPVERSSPPKAGDVLDASFDSGNALVIKCPPLPAVRNRIRIRPNFIRAKALQMLALAIEHTHMRAKEFVRRADKKIAIERGDIDESMRGVVDGIDIGKSSDLVRKADDPFHRIDGSNAIGRIANRDQLR